MMNAHRVLIVGSLLFSSCEHEVRLETSAVPMTEGTSVTEDATVPVPSLSLRLTPEEAYAKGNHRRTALDLRDSDLDANVRRYVEEMFACIDEGIALRITTLDDFFAGQSDIESYSKAHKQLEVFIRSRTPPADLRGYHDKLLEAFGAQHEFFAEWARKGAAFPGKNVFLHPAVLRCSQALHAAYGIIKQKIGPLAANQRQAFYDYHCALDFL